MTQIDDEFYQRADEHINLSNQQLDKATKGKVSASMMYGLARFNAWVSACNWNTREELKGAFEETVEYFSTEYKKMLVENLEDYVDNFDKYMEKGDYSTNA